MENQNLKCSPFPSGILGCSVYSNINTCKECKDNWYLDNNICEKVPIEN